MIFEIDRDYKLESDRSELKKQVMSLEDKISDDARRRDELVVDFVLGGFC